MACAVRTPLKRISDLKRTEKHLVRLIIGTDVDAVSEVALDHLVWVRGTKAGLRERWARERRVRRSTQQTARNLSRRVRRA